MERQWVFQKSCTLLQRWPTWEEMKQECGLCGFPGMCSEGAGRFYPSHHWAMDIFNSSFNEKVLGLYSKYLPAPAATVQQERGRSASFLSAPLSFTCDDTFLLKTSSPVPKYTWYWVQLDNLICTWSMSGQALCFKTWDISDSCKSTSSQFKHFCFPKMLSAKGRGLDKKNTKGDLTLQMKMLRC